jgi:hypothetical protein
MGKHLVYFLLGLLLGTNAYAQSSPSLVTWSDFNYTYGFNTTWGTGGDAGVRGLISDPDWTSLYIRPVFIYRNTDQLNFGFSVAAFQNFNNSSPDLFEFRPAQQVNLVWPEFEKWSLKSRLRFEERYLVTEQAEGQVNNDPRWEFRGRYELKFKTEPFDIAFVKNTYLLASGEYFIPLSQEAEQLFADQNRLLVGYGQRIGQVWSYELQFFWQRTRNTSVADLTTDQYVLRLRIFLRNEPREFVDED